MTRCQPQQQLRMSSGWNGGEKENGSERERVSRLDVVNAGDAIVMGKLQNKVKIKF